MDRMSRFIMIALVALVAGCQTVKTYDPDTGKKISSVPQDIAALQAMKGIIQAKNETLLVIADMDPQAQRYLVIRGDMFTDEMQSYIAGENSEVQSASAVATGGFWTLIGLSAFKTIQKGYDAAGDSYQVGDITQTKSDDPYGGGEGSPGGDVPGGNAITIGRENYVATDHGAISKDVDKNIQSQFGNKATSNLDDSTEPNRINDAEEIKDNKAGLFPL